MGIPKHGQASAGTKNSAKYKLEGRREKNKRRKAEKREKKLARIQAKKTSRE